MLRDTATTFLSPLRGSRPALAALCVLAGTILMPCTASAEHGYGPAHTAGHRVLPPHAFRAHRCGPPRRACHARGPYGSPALVRAYLPRNNALPMYNEPPPRFPEH